MSRLKTKLFPFAIGLVLVVLVSFQNLSAVEREPFMEEGKNSNNSLKGISYVGIRLGINHITQEDPDVAYTNYNVSANRDGFYTEGFFNWHFMNEIALEVGLASASRGEFTWRTPDGTLFGNINLYPIMAGLKIKPLASLLVDHYQPYVSGGGSFVIGRAVVEGANFYDPYIYYDPSLEDETTFGWWLGGGFDSFISTTICLTADVKYQHINFGTAIGGYENHSGYQISVGAAYIFRNK